MSNSDTDDTRRPTLEMMGYQRDTDGVYRAHGTRLGALASDGKHILADPLALWHMLTDAGLPLPASAEDFIRLMRDMEWNISLPADSAPENVALLKRLRAGTAEGLMHALAGMRAQIIMPTGGIWPDLRRETGGAQ